MVNGITISQEKMEELITQTTDTYIRHFESEIKYVQEKSKLSLWIIGLSIGMELFVLNKLEARDMLSFRNRCLLGITGSIFLINSFLGLNIRLKQTRLYSYFLKIITFYDYQRTKIALNMNPSLPLAQEIMQDFSEGKAIEKIKNLVYIDEQKEKDNPLMQKDMNFLNMSDNWPSTLLILQAIFVALLFVNMV